MPKNITWGISESVLVDDDLVFVTPAGAKALMAALDKKTARKQLAPQSSVSLSSFSFAVLSQDIHRADETYALPIAHGESKASMTKLHGRCIERARRLCPSQVTFNANELQPRIHPPTRLHHL